METSEFLLRGQRRPYWRRLCVHLSRSRTTRGPIKSSGAGEMGSARAAIHSGQATGSCRVVRAWVHLSSVRSLQQG
eukprot:1881820-Prymnesium_polylepis.1